MIRRVVKLFKMAWHIDRRGITGSFLELLTAMFIPLQAWLLSTITTALVVGDHKGAMVYIAVIAAVTGLTTLLQVLGTNGRLRLVDNLTRMVEETTMRRLGELSTLDAVEDPAVAQLMSTHMNQRGSIGRSLNVWLVAAINLTRAISLCVAAVVVSPWLLLVVLFSLPHLYLGLKARAMVEDAVDDTAALGERVMALADPLVAADGGDDLRLLRAGDFYRSITAKATDQWLAPQRRAVRAGTALEGLGAGLVMVGFALAIGGTLLGSTEVEAVATLTAVAYILVGMTGVGQILYFVMNLLSGADRALLRWEEFHELVERQTNDGTAKPHTGAGLLLEDVGYTYGISAVSLEVPLGKVTAIVGPNGSGKSTLAALLLGLRVPTRGNITLPEGAPVAYVPQDAVHLPARLHDNVALGRDLDNASLQQAIERAGGLPWTDGEEFLQPNRSVVMGDARYPSGGQWKRIAVARAQQTTGPQVEIFDEPTAALDADSVRTLMEHVLFAPVDARGARIIITHDLAIAERADHLVVLNAGKVEAAREFTTLLHDGVSPTLVALAQKTTE